ncbi:MAG: TniQ family protein [Burkholderiaceae bacterium]
MLSNRRSKPSRGLPLVPPAQPNEALGSWLFRVASKYDLNPERLLQRLNARLSPYPKFLSWSELDRKNIDLNALSTSLQCSSADLHAMTVGQYKRKRSMQAGVCSECLRQSISTFDWPVWSRHWFNPLVVACEQHGQWLTPIDISLVRQLRSPNKFRHFSEVLCDGASSNTDADDTHMSAVIWLQRYCTGRQPKEIPWVDKNGLEFVRAIALLSRSAARGFEYKEEIAGFLSSSTGHFYRATLPIELAERRIVLSSVANVMRFPTPGRKPPPELQAAKNQSLCLPMFAPKTRTLGSSNPRAAAEEKLCEKNGPILQIQNGKPKTLKLTLPLFDRLAS